MSALVGAVVSALASAAVDSFLAAEPPPQIVINNYDDADAPNCVGPRPTRRFLEELFLVSQVADPGSTRGAGPR